MLLKLSVVLNAGSLLQLSYSLPEDVRAPYRDFRAGGLEVNGAGIPTAVRVGVFSVCLADRLARAYHRFLRYRFLIVPYRCTRYRFAFFM